MLSSKRVLIWPLKALLHGGSQSNRVKVNQAGDHRSLGDRDNGGPSKNVGPHTGLGRD